MLAIHNCLPFMLVITRVANAYAKLSKCQQFTTKLLLIATLSVLQTLMQSYQNVSNSQLMHSTVYKQISCKRLCKVIKMLAIHNYLSIIYFSTIVANAYAKLSKCQQFTTQTGKLNEPVKLQTLMQSYQNVSNSQLYYGIIANISCCKRFCKVIKMLAIHNVYNYFVDSSFVANAYAKLSKCQQFTTFPILLAYTLLLQTLMQSYQNVSNSQPTSL